MMNCIDTRVEQEMNRVELDKGRLGREQKRWNGRVKDHMRQHHCSRRDAEAALKGDH
jgi:hypothetical protein